VAAARAALDQAVRVALAAGDDLDAAVRAPRDPSDVLEAKPGVELYFVKERVIGLAPDGLFALDGVEPEGLRKLLDLADRGATVRDVIAAMAHDYDADDVLGLIRQLEDVVIRRVAVTSAPTRDPAPSSAREADPSLSPLRIAVIGQGALAASIVTELAADRFATVTRIDGVNGGSRAHDASGADVVTWPARRDHMLRSNGDGGVDDDGDGGAGDLAGRLRDKDAIVCALEQVRGQAFLDVGAACAQAGVSVLFVAMEGDECVVGPLVTRRGSPCFACSRLSTLLVDVFDDSGPRLLPHIAFGALNGGASPWARRVALEARAELDRYLCKTGYPQRIGSLLSIDRSGTTRIRLAEAVTSCPLCGGLRGAAHDTPTAPTPQGPCGVERSPAPICDETGGARSVGAEEAVLRAEAAFAILGVELTCIPLTGEVAEALSSVACPFFGTLVSARHDDGLPIVFRQLRGPSYGKGTTEVQARCSAYYEWLERNLSEWRGEHELIRASYAQVQDRAIDLPFHLSGLLPGLERAGKHPLDPHEDIDWVWGECLVRRRPILIPATAVFFGETLFFGASIEFPRAGSSGLSAGCSLADATLQGLLEIVERDATFTAMRNGSLHSPIAVEGITDPAARDLLGRVRAAGYTPHLRDITSSLGVPVVEAYLVRDEGWEHAYAPGYGAHLDPRIALRRAVTEAAQSLFGAAIDPGYDVLRSETSYFELSPHRLQVLDRKGEPRVWSESADGPPPRDVWEQIDVVVSRVARAIPRADICAVDLSSPALPGVHVVRTLITGALDEARRVQIHIPQRCRLVPLGEMYLGPISM